MKLFYRARRKILGISPDEVRISRRGFRCSNSAAAETLENIGKVFLGGYHAALEEPSIAALGIRIHRTFLPESSGFAYEGAGMALMLLDRLGLSRGSFRAFLRGPGAPHAYMVHVGAGWAFARLPWVRSRLSHALTTLDPLLRWLAVDGYGFHEGYFHWPVVIERHILPRGLTGYAVRAFDQGLGRSLWFVEAADPERIATSISRFPYDRRRDLWAGVGLACAYAGGAGPTALARLVKLAGEDASAAAQGAVFAAEARRRAGNPANHCDFACRALCGMPANLAAPLAEQAKVDLPASQSPPAYEVWRTRIQQHFSCASHGVCL